MKEKKSERINKKERKKERLQAGCVGAGEKWLENKNEQTYFRNEGSQVHGALVIQYKETEALLQNISFRTQFPPPPLSNP